jgi:hypothetical protein
MKRASMVLWAALVAGPAAAVGNLADVTVINRSTGETLPMHFHRGEYWVAGRPGDRYAVHIRNQNHRRLLAVTSVDGINVITGETAGVNQRGYIYDPWVGYEIAGWRKSSAEIAAFNFTSVPRSYAAKTGRPDNVGVIGVALFLEQQQIYEHEHDLAKSNRAPAPTAPAPQQESAAAAGAAADASSESYRAERRERQSSPSLGTGHGRRESSYVQHVAFERESARPNEVIRIRYDSYNNLVALGVIKRPDRPRVPQAFPEGPQLGYVPDP